MTFSICLSSGKMKLYNILHAQPFNLLFVAVDITVGQLESLATSGMTTTDIRYEPRLTLTNSNFNPYPYRLYYMGQFLSADRALKDICLWKGTMALVVNAGSIRISVSPLGNEVTKPTVLFVDPWQTIQFVRMNLELATGLFSFFFFCFSRYRDNNSCSKVFLVLMVS